MARKKSATTNYATARSALDVRRDAVGAGEPWPRRWRILASLAIGFHVLAVFLAPLAAPPPSSLLARRMAGAIEPYLRGLAINNGYRFFAPNPGPSHLVRYEIEMSDGRVESGVFPDPDKHWPRLLYHRYFMLAETVYNHARNSAEPPADVFTQWSAIQQQEFRAYQAQAQTLYRAIARDLARDRTQVRRVRLYSRTHEIPTPDQLQDGLRLSDARLYLDVPLAEFSRDEL